MMNERTENVGPTPGPWRHEPYEGSHESAIIGNLYQIATVQYDDFEHANARLIAAAPELLAACKAIWSDWRNHHQLDDPDWEGQSTLNLVRSAIAKAEGRDA